MPPESPLPPHMFLVLLALNAGPSHGYGIKKAVAERSDGSVDLDAGGLYRLIARLEEWGWAETVDAPEADADPRRKYYALTTGGQAILRREARRVASLARDPDVAALAEAPSGG